MLFVAEQTTRLRGKNPDLTERVARGVNTVCRRWLERRCRSADLKPTAVVIRYQQTRNDAQDALCRNIPKTAVVIRYQQTRNYAAESRDCGQSSFSGSAVVLNGREAGAFSVSKMHAHGAEWRRTAAIV